MKSRFQSILLCVIAFLASCSQIDKNSLSELNLKGDVKSIKVINYEALSKFGEFSKGDVRSSGNYQFNFNKQGMVDDKMYYDNRGDVEIKEVFAFGAGADLKEVNVYYGDGDLSSKIIYSYKDEFMISQDVYNPEGELISKVNFENDGVNIIKGIYIKDNYNLGVYWINTWKDNKLVETINYNDEGNEKSKSIYDNSGKLSKLIMEGFTSEFNYNKYGDVIKSVNAEIEIVNFSLKEGLLYFYEYEYDSKNNWIKRTRFRNEEKTPEIIEEREIEYY